MSVVVYPNVQSTCDPDMAYVSMNTSVLTIHDLIHTPLSSHRAESDSTTCGRYMAAETIATTDPHTPQLPEVRSL